MCYISQFAFHFPTKEICYQKCASLVSPYQYRYLVSDYPEINTVADMGDTGA